ncbi:unnamed protein product [Phytomonas sp. Hart1]|nr:unnamed protein product [Phytomonas sp. Hart1]|eukprot:CCW71624.1 unnamed protein product [Phytomonas sp. isolate Hart1]
MIDRIYVCNMGRALAACTRALLRTFPAAVVGRVEIVSDADLRRGVLREFVNADRLPVSLGGHAADEDPDDWAALCDHVVDYYTGLQRGVLEDHLTVKEWELRELKITAEAMASSWSPLEQTTRAPSPQQTASKLSFSWTAGARSEGSTLSRRLLRTCTENLSESSLDNCEEEEEEEKEKKEEEEDSGTWRSIMKPFEFARALSFLEELLCCRNEIESEELGGRLLITELARARLTEIVNKKVLTEPIGENKNNQNTPNSSLTSLAKESRNSKESSKKRVRYACFCVVC